MAVKGKLSFRQHRKLIALIKKGMSERGWKVGDLAEASGYSERSIYRLFNPKIKASSSCVYEVTRIFGIEMEDLK